MLFAQVQEWNFACTHLTLRSTMPRLCTFISAMIGAAASELKENIKLALGSKCTCSAGTTFFKFFKFNITAGLKCLQSSFPPLPQPERRCAFSNWLPFYTALTTRCVATSYRCSFCVSVAIAPRTAGN